MVKILNKLFYILKNIMLPILLLATIYIVAYMFQRLEKNMFGEDLYEFIFIIVPYLLLIILSFINFTFYQKSVSKNFFYNITSFIIMLTIGVFCYRALFDSNMILWHRYGYNINFHYFSDQIAPIKVMLYGLSVANILLMIEGYIKLPKEEVKTVNKKNNTNVKKIYKNKQKNQYKMNKNK